MDLVKIMASEEFFGTYQEASRDGVTSFPLYLKRVIEASSTEMAAEYCKQPNRLDLLRKAHEGLKVTKDCKKAELLVDILDCGHKNKEILEDYLSNLKIPTYLS